MDKPRPKDHLPFFKVGNMATGFIAIGNVAYGFIAIGFSAAIGPIAIGLNAVGSILAIGLNTIGLLSLAAINAAGLFALAGVNVLGGFGAAAVNSGIHPLLAVVFGLVSIGGSRLFPKPAETPDLPPGVPKSREKLPSLMRGPPRQGWIEARLEVVEVSNIQVQTGGQRTPLVAGPEVVTRIKQLAERVGGIPCHGYFQVESSDALQVSKDTDYRIAPENLRELRCLQAVLIEPPAPFWARKSALHRVNRVSAVVVGILSILGGLLAESLL